MGVIAMKCAPKTGMHVSLTQQVQQVEDTYEQLSLALGEAAAANLFSRSVFFVSIGRNNFIHYHLRNVSGVQMRYLQREFNQLLVNTVRQEIKNLYNINVRKVILMDLPPVGCAPHFLEEYGSQNGECIDYINNVVIEFNHTLSYMSSEFIRHHPDSMISYCDTFEGSVDILNNRDRYGFVTTTYACRGLGKYGGLIMCILP
ncbi:GDSL esterase/lipase At1g29660-like [Phragmites australis]|uniref:GDSL esterase/lipase At1g29660-like n=1 Tax=Phragmites australis TaxID=29695 RepID=UPI002D7A1574|nr:GDSL esterase/lipase At1g29660-like [Phragmites australis]